MTDQLDVQINEEKPRPAFLTTLCVLSFISTGLGVVSTFFTLLSGKQSEEAMLDAKVEMTKSISDLKNLGMDSWVDMMNQIQAMTEEVNNNFYLASFVSIIVASVGLYGVIQMWKGFKIGFHIYIMYCLLSIAAIYIYVSPVNIPSIVVIFNLVLSGLFVFMYSRNLHWMNK